MGKEDCKQNARCKLTTRLFCFQNKCDWNSNCLDRNLRRERPRQKPPPTQHTSDKYPALLSNSTIGMTNATLLPSNLTTGMTSAPLLPSNSTMDSLLDCPSNKNEIIALSIFFSMFIGYLTAGIVAKVYDRIQRWRLSRMIDRAC